MEILTKNLIKDGKNTDFLKSTFSITDSQKTYDVKPEEDLKKIETLEKEIAEAKNLKPPKNVVGLVANIIKTKEHDKFILNRNLVRLNNKFKIDVHSLI